MGNAQAFRPAPGASRAVHSCTGVVA